MLAKKITGIILKVIGIIGIIGGVVCAFMLMFGLYSHGTINGLNPEVIGLYIFMIILPALGALELFSGMHLSAESERLISFIEATLKTNNGNQEISTDVRVVDGLTTNYSNV